MVNIIIIFKQVPLKHSERLAMKLRKMLIECIGVVPSEVTNFADIVELMTKTRAEEAKEAR